MQPFFRIVRPSAWHGASLPLDIYIDGIKVGSVANNQTKDFPTSSGEHEIYVKMEWYRSPAFRAEMIEGNESKAMVMLECAFPSTPNFLTFFLMSFGDKDKFFTLKLLHPIARD